MSTTAANVNGSLCTGPNGVNPNRFQFNRFRAMRRAWVSPIAFGQFRVALGSCRFSCNSRSALLYFFGRSGRAGFDPHQCKISSPSLLRCVTG